MSGQLSETTMEKLKIYGLDSLAKDDMTIAYMDDLDFLLRDNDSWSDRFNSGSATKERAGLSQAMLLYGFELRHGFRMMDSEEAAAQEFVEGYSDIREYDDSPGPVHDWLAHEKFTTHIIIEGSMNVTRSMTHAHIDTETYTAGKRYDIKAREMHKVEAGPEGCRYVVGKK